MKRTLTTVDLDKYPSEIANWLKGSTVYDSSCSKDATVLFIDKDQGYFLKEGAAQSLKTESIMHAYFHGLGLTSRLVAYQTEEDKAYLLTERVPGEDCAHSEYLAKPERLCDIIAQQLRQLHALPVDSCPIKNRIDSYSQMVIDGHNAGHYDGGMFEGIWEFKSAQETWSIAQKGLDSLEREVLMHGDYCLPNIILDDWKFSGYVDLINAGLGDRHIDILWAIWSLKHNLKTAKYTDRFIDAYGSDLVNRDKLQAIAALEMFG